MATHVYTSALIAVLLAAIIGVTGIFGTTGAAVFNGGQLSFLSSDGLLSTVLVMLGLVFGYLYVRRKSR